MRSITNQELNQVSGGYDNDMVIDSALLSMYWFEDAMLEAHTDGMVAGVLSGAVAGFVASSNGYSTITSVLTGLAVGSWGYQVGFYNSDAWSWNW